MVAKCPNPECGKVLLAIESYHVDSKPGDSKSLSWPMIVAACPFCRTTLGAQIDPCVIGEAVAREMARA